MIEIMDFMFNLCRTCALATSVMFIWNLITIIFNSLFNKNANKRLLLMLIYDFLAFMLFMFICYKGHYEPISNTAEWEYIVLFAMGTMLHFCICKNEKNIKGSEMND